MIGPYRERSLLSAAIIYIIQFRGVGPRKLNKLNETSKEKHEVDSSYGRIKLCKVNKTHNS